MRIIKAYDLARDNGLPVPPTTRYFNEIDVVLLDLGDFSLDHGLGPEELRRYNQIEVAEFLKLLASTEA